MYVQNTDYRRLPITAYEMSTNLVLLGVPGKGLVLNMILSNFRVPGTSQVKKPIVKVVSVLIYI